MIEIIFNYASEVIIVRINGKEVLFGSTMYGAQLAHIDGLRLDFHGTIREFPDLKNDIEWKSKAINRFKDHIKSLKTEDEVADYIINELRTKGYTPKLKQKSGFRPVKLS